MEDTSKLLSSPRLTAEERESVDVNALLTPDPQRKRDPASLLEATETFFRMGADLDAFAFAEDALRSPVADWDMDTTGHLLLIHATSALRMNCGEVYLQMVVNADADEANAKNEETEQEQNAATPAKHWLAQFVENTLQTLRRDNSRTLGHYAMYRDTRPEREPDYVRAVLQKYRESKKAASSQTAEDDTANTEDSLDAVDVVPCPEKGGFKMITTRPIAKDECFFLETALVSIGVDDFTLSEEKMGAADRVMFFDDQGEDTGWSRFASTEDPAGSTLLSLKLLVLIERGLVPAELVSILRNWRDKVLEPKDGFIQVTASDRPGLGAIDRFTDVSRSLKSYFRFQREVPSLGARFGARDFFNAVFTVKEIAHRRPSGYAEIYVIGSFMNHCNEPTARYDSPEGEFNKLRFTALRDIAAGEEITINYYYNPEVRPVMNK